MATLIHASLHAYLMTDTHKNSPKTFHEKMISKLLEHAASDAMLPWSILKYSRLICTIPTFCATFSLSTISEVIWRMVFLPWKMFIGMCGSIIMRRRQITKERPSGSPVESIGLVSNMLSDLVHPMLSFVLVLCCLPLMLLVSIVYRLSNNALTSTILKRNSDVIMVQSQDTLCLQRARSNVDILNCLLLLKGRMDLAKLRKLVLERLVEARGESGHLLLPKLTRYCKSIAGCYVWVKDETYDVIDHVFKWNSQCPSTREELETLLGYLSSQPLPKEKAPWQVVMIPSSSMLERQCFVLFRIHHSIADSANFSEKILRPLVDVKPTLSQKPVSGVTKKYMEALKVLSMGPSVLLQKLSLPVEDHCLYGQPLSGDRLTTWSEQLDLALIKEMARASKSTTNAVLLSCLTGTFRDYFKHHSHKIPEDMLAYVSVPSEISSKSLISKDNSVFVILSLPLKLNDPIRHLEVIQSRMESSATSVEPAINTLISSQFTGKVPLWMSSLLDRIIADKCTLVLCEASCPQSKVFIGGNAVEDIILWSGQPANVGIGVTVVSYNGQVKLTIMADRAIMTDPAFLLSNFEAQLEHLARTLNVL